MATAFLLLLAACGGGSTPHLRIAAASDLRFALDEISVSYSEPVDIVYGSSGAFYTQIRNGAPFDLYFSADSEYPRRLADEGLILEGSELVYATGRIVLWSAAGPVDAHTLRDPAIRKIAIANPQHAPYGRAAEAALRSLSLYEPVKDKLILGENVAQALQFVQSGGADVGIIALALALAPTVEGQHWELPLDAYPRMEQSSVILRGARDPESARAFRDFVLDEGRPTLDRYGLTLPEAE